jgi:hypothetical protein
MIHRFRSRKYRICPIVFVEPHSKKEKMKYSGGTWLFSAAGLDIGIIGKCPSETIIFLKTRIRVRRH